MSARTKDTSSRPDRSVIDASALCARSESLATKVTEAPRRASCTAVSKPRPEVAPVKMTDAPGRALGSDQCPSRRRAS
jgi:hypothetical protein